MPEEPKSSKGRFQGLPNKDHMAMSHAVLWLPPKEEKVILHSGLWPHIPASLSPPLTPLIRLDSRAKGRLGHGPRLGD